MALHNWTSSCHDCTAGKIHCAKPFCFCYICRIVAIQWLLTFTGISLDENGNHEFTLSSGQALDLLDLETDIKIHHPFVIANYVYPTKWDFIGDRVQEDARIKLNFGIHLHMIAKPPFLAAIDQSRRLKEMFRRHPGAIGIGEVGLDFTVTCTCSSGHDIKQCIASKKSRISANSYVLPYSLFVWCLTTHQPLWVIASDGIKLNMMKMEKVKIYKIK